MRSQWTAKHILDSVPSDYPKDKPIFILNMFRFHDQAQYPEGSKYSPCSGKEAFDKRYVKEWGEIISAAGGWEIIYYGEAATVAIGGENEKWDSIAINQYKNLETLRKGIAGESYAASALEHRNAALKDWKVVFSIPVPGSPFADRPKI